METPTVPPIAISDVVAVFGGSGVLASYLAGGAHVPSGTVGTYGPVPSSLPIALTQLCGCSNYLQQVTVGVGTSGGPYPLYGFSNTLVSDFGTISDDAFYGGGNFRNFYWNTSSSVL